MSWRRDYDGTADLLAKIIAGTVDLAGALCTGRPDLFNEDPTPERFGQALEVCQRCPVRSRCWEWSSTTRVAGVTASTWLPPRSTVDTSVAGDRTGGRPSTHPEAARTRRYRANKRALETREGHHSNG